MVDLFGKIILLCTILVFIRLYQIYNSPLIAYAHDKIYYPETSLDRLKQLLVLRKHILLTGSAGIDKAKMVELTTTIPTIGSSTVLVPIVVNLKNLAREDSAAEYVDSVTAAFVNGVNSFEVEALRRLRKDPVEYLALFLNYHWKQMFTFTNSDSTQSFSTIAGAISDSSPTSALVSVLDLNENINKLFFTVKGSKAKKLIPVLVIDEFQVLGDSALASTRQQLSMFLKRNLIPRDDSKLNCVLVSSENNPRKAVRECKCFISLLLCHPRSFYGQSHLKF